MIKSSSKFNLGTDSLIGNKNTHIAHSKDCVFAVRLMNSENKISLVDIGDFKECSRCRPLMSQSVFVNILEEAY